MKVGKDVNPKVLETKNLKRIVKKCKDFYYNTGKELVPDNIYDKLEKELKNRGESIEVGSPNKSKKVNLPCFIGSLKKIKPNSSNKWIIPNEEYLISDKLDGIALLIEYNGESLPKLYSRGDGSKGKDLTYLNKGNILGLPPLFKKLLIRAEVVIDKDIFLEKYKEEAENPRAFVSGIMNRLELYTKALHDIDVIAHELINIDNTRLKPYDQIKILKSLRFNTCPCKVFNNVSKDILINLLNKRKDKSNFDIDGLVLTINKSGERENIKYPSYSRAFKIDELEETSEAIVHEVEWNTSRHSYLNPKIIINPIKLSGVTIKQLTGFNAKYIFDNYINKGTMLKIRRSGDVIPHIDKVIKASKEPSLPNYEWDWTSDTRVNIKIKSNSSEVKVKKISHFFKTIGVEDLSLKRIEKLYENGYTNILKIIKFKIVDVIKIEGFKHKLAKKILDSIKDSLTNIPLEKLAHASMKFGRDVGEERFKLVYDNYPDLMKRNLTIEDIVNIKGFSYILAEKFYNRLPKFFKFMVKLDKYVKIKDIKISNNSKQRFLNKKIVFTGFRDNELKSSIESEGGKIINSLSSKVSLLLIKDNNYKSTKVDKAKKLSIPIETSEEFKLKFDL